MSTPPSPLEALGYILIVVSSMLTMEQIRNLTWYVDDDSFLRVSIDLVGGGGVDTAVSLELEDDPLAWAMLKAFDDLQQDLPEKEQFWGQPIPPCRPGHAHGAWCRQSGNKVELYCPSDENTVRVLAILPGTQSPV
jgi:hypothetical protein